MDFEVRYIRPDEIDEILTLDERAFGYTYGDADRENLRGLLELDRMHVAVDGDDIVGTAGAWTFDMTVPGGAAVPVAGVTWVGVMPTHRRRGILRQLMERQLDEVAAAGREPIAVLTASESGIYGRVGYGVASFRARMSVATKRVRMRDGVGTDGQVRFLGLEAARATLPAVYDRMRAVVPGTLSRQNWWDEVLADRESQRYGASGLFVLAHPDGYALYRRRDATAPNGALVGEVVLIELTSVSAEAHASLWRTLLELDLVEQLFFRRYSVDDPLPLLLTEPRRVQIDAAADDVWVRILDVPAALEARRYLTEGRVVLDVADGFRPVTGGRFVLEAGPDGARCAPTTADADLALDISGLGSLYLGGMRATTLARAGLVEERTPGAAFRADVLFASDTPPHNQTPF